jgi:hypothetical protein
MPVVSVWHFPHLRNGKQLLISGRDRRRARGPSWSNRGIPPRRSTWPGAVDPGARWRVCLAEWRCDSFAAGEPHDYAPSTVRRMLHPRCRWRHVTGGAGAAAAPRRTGPRARCRSGAGRRPGTGAAREPAVESGGVATGHCVDTSYISGLNPDGASKFPL